MTRWTVRQGFGKGRVKEYFITEIENDGTLRAHVAGPFETGEQAGAARDALQPLYPLRALAILGGHLASLGSD